MGDTEVLVQFHTDEAAQCTLEGVATKMDAPFLRLLSRPHTQRNAHGADVEECAGGDLDE